MWEFIKYCFWCAWLVIWGSLGTNPEGSSWKTTIVGGLTIAVISFICAFIYVISKFNKK